MHATESVVQTEERQAARTSLQAFSGWRWFRFAHPRGPDVPDPESVVYRVAFLFAFVMTLYILRYRTGVSGRIRWRAAP